jgi:hypothetical protein
VLKKASRKSAEVNDVPADDPMGTMDRFTSGLRKVLQKKKLSTPRAGVKGRRPSSA